MKVCKLIFSVLFIIYLFPFTSYAFNLADYFVVTIDETSIPKDAKYLELLVRVENIENSTNNIGNKTTLKNYDIEDFQLDNFISYTYYFCDSSDFLQLNNCSKFDGLLLCEFGENDTNILNYDEIRFAYLNEERQVILVTNCIKTDSIIPYYHLEQIELNSNTAIAKFHLFYQNYIFFIGVIILVFTLTLLVLKKHFKKINLYVGKKKK